MKAKTLISKLRKENIKLVLDEEGSIEIVSFKGKISADLIQEIKSNKSDLIDFLSSNQKDSSISIPALPEAEDYVLSSAQRRLWMSSQSEESSLSYNVSRTVSLGNEYDKELFQKIIESIIDRHEVFRTVFITNEKEEVRQKILTKEALGFQIDYKDFRGVEDERNAISAYIDSESNRPFDLENGPLVRVSVLQTTDQGFLFYYNMHHIISDGWSMNVLEKDVQAYFEAYQSGQEVDLPALNIQYKDYAAWQVAQLETPEFKKHQEYWTNTFSGDLPVLDLPSYKSRPSVKTHNGGLLSTYISNTTTQALQDYCRAEGGSLFMGLLATWNVLCSKYTDQNDIIVSTPVAEEIIQN